MKKLYLDPLKIPKSFCKYNWELPSENCAWERGWYLCQVRLVEQRNHIFIEHGWDDFVEANDIL
jgi:hypothetical protein